MRLTVRNQILSSFNSMAYVVQGRDCTFEQNEAMSTSNFEFFNRAEKFDVTQPFLLQQAAWLYERQLSQVRAQMRKVGPWHSATPSPGPASMSGSALSGQFMKRDGSGGMALCPTFATS